MTRLSIHVIPLLLVLTVFLASPASANAHPITFINYSLKYVCLSPYSGVNSTMYNNQTPTHRNWAITVNFLLQGGDRYQNIWFDASVWDDSTNADWRFRHSTFDWVIPNQAQFSSTITPHIGSTFDMLVGVDNQDAASQCFYLWADAGYY